MDFLYLISDWARMAISKIAENQRLSAGKRYYYYAHSELDKSGKKTFQDYKKPILNWRSRTHIFTALPAKDDSKLVYGIPLDLDYEKADSRWKSRGKLDHRKMRSFLLENYPEFSRYLCTWTRSTGGRGLGVILFIDPFLKGSEGAASVEFLARRVQYLLIEVLNFHGMGCDPNASGFCRWTPNWRNGRILLHKDEVTIRRVQRENEWHGVLRIAYNELRRSKALKPETRAEKVKKGLRFAVKDSTDVALAKIYAHIIDESPESLCISSSYEDLSKLSGLSIPTLRKNLCEASWLLIERLWGEGLRLTLKTNHELTKLAYEAPTRLNKRSPSLASPGRSEWDLPDPEEVDSDSRNDFIWRKAVLLRNEGMSLDDAISEIGGLIKRIPGHEESRNCRNYETIVISIFNRSEKRSKNIKRKIFSLEVKAKPLSILPHLGSVNQPQVTDSLSDTAAGEEDKKIPLSDRGEAARPGDLPQQKEVIKDEEMQSPTERPEFGLLLAFAPEAAKSIIEGRSTTAPSQNDVACEKKEPLISPLAPVVDLPKVRTFRTIKELRKHNYDSVDILDRFETCFFRCLKRKTEAQIVAELNREAPKMVRLGVRYSAPKGAYRRVLAAFGKLPARLREDLLRVLQE